MSKRRTTGRKYYVFYYERGDRKAKEYLGPFGLKTNATRARDSDSKKYGTPRSQYKIRHLTEAEFRRAWF